MEKMKNYQKPIIRVVKLQQRSHLLSGSQSGGSNAREMRGIDKDFEE